MAGYDPRQLLARVGESDPELAARLVLMSLPAAAARIPGSLVYDLTVDGLGTRRISVADGTARVERHVGDADDGASLASAAAETDFRMSAEPRALVALATGSARPLGLMLRGAIRVRGKRRRLLRLRRMGGEPVGLDQVVAAGGTLDVDALFRSLPYAIDPEWTRGHAFCVRYELGGEGGGSWWIEIRDGERPRAGGPELPEGVEPVATVRLTTADYVRLATGELTPDESMRERRTRVDGELHPVTLLGRWIDRGQGRDDAELEREARQRELQEAREGMYGGRPGRDGLLDYRQLYALWERQQWKAHEIDFGVDREQWLVLPTPVQENLIWTLGSFAVGEQRVTTDLAPFLLAAPSGEVELFLATQLVDEARHAVFFDRFGAEVLALEADDLRGRIAEVEARLGDPWHAVFDDGLRDIANRIKARPDDRSLFVEGVATYHLIVEGFLAVTGQTLIRDYLLAHSLYPGFCEGFGFVERDEHRHVAFGVRFLRDAIEADPSHRATVERVVLELTPRAAHVFAPPYATDHANFVSYGYDSAQIYGLAYRTLKRRMGVLGIEIPSADELMPGPIAETGAFAALSLDAAGNAVRGNGAAPAAVAATNGSRAAASNGGSAAPVEAPAPEAV